MNPVEEVSPPVGTESTGKHGNAAVEELLDRGVCGATPVMFYFVQDLVPDGPTEILSHG